MDDFLSEVNGVVLEETEQMRARHGLTLRRKDRTRVGEKYFFCNDRACLELAEIGLSAPFSSTC